PPLLFGGCLHLIAEDRAVDAAALGDYFAEHPIDVLKIAPSHLSALLAAERERVLPRRLLVIGGEAWRPDLVERLRRLAPGCTVFNHYGPTETTVGVLAFRPPARPRHATVTVPLGRPLAAARCHVLDRHGRPLPAGVAGELYVGGACVARGYLGRPELTADRFVPDPFTPLPGERLYRTGDLVRRLADGSVEFLGRLDHQVKIRGFRIEPGEVEHWLARHPGVAETVVLARRDDAGEALLAAYVVASPGAPAPAAAELRAHLAARLPEAMVPSAFVFLPALPRTAHGKLNRSALPAPERAGERPPQPVTLPRDPIELALAQIWEELLGVHPISVHDDFFELGGHSLLAVRLMSRIERRFGRGLPLSQLSQGATVAAFGRALRAIGGGAAASSPLVEIQPGDGARRPLFLVHPAGGNVLCYLPLARGLGREQPVFGLQDPALFQTGEPGFDVEEMAACYLEALRAVQARGPYVLGGWSLGGVIAQEMAQRLEQGGDDVALLLLLDARCPAVAGREAQDEDQVLLWFAAQLGVEITPGELAAESAKRRFDLVLARARAGGALPADLEPHQARRIFAVYAAEMSAVARHRPRPCRAHALLLRAAAGVAEERSRGEDERLGWAGLTGGEIQTAVVPGSHHTLLEEPAVSAVAEQIRTRLAAISAAE
ncbi:MAG TPA: thioesterase domain-containing protein, partial [Thermoanaerobaculia bacterium]|nr:thioesterase domain-containing protein [Thermoanaerobaculia bacterium]